MGIHLQLIVLLSTFATLADIGISNYLATAQFVHRGLEKNYGFKQIGPSFCKGIKPLQSFVSSCSEAYESGAYTTAVGYQYLHIYCEVDEFGTRWTVIQRRGPFGEVNDYFNKGYDSYRFGFGDPKGQLWLGLKAISTLTSNNSNPYQLRIDLEDWEGNSVFVTADHFRVSSQEDGFKFHYNSSQPSHLREGLPRNGLNFSTYDNDNDINADRNCAQENKGGWWYDDCHVSNLNGIYYGGPHNSPADGVNYIPFRQDRYSLKSTVMKIRPLLDQGKYNPTVADD